MTTAEILQTALCPYFFAGRSIRNRKMCIEKIDQFLNQKNDLLSLAKDSRDLETLINYTLTDNQRLLMNYCSKPEFEEMKFTNEGKNKFTLLKLYEYYTKNKFAEKSEIESALFKKLDKHLAEFFEGYKK